MDMEEKRYNLKKKDSEEEILKRLEEKVDMCIEMLNDLCDAVASVEKKIAERDQRDVNRAIRQFSMKGNSSKPLGFVPSSSQSISELLHR